MRFKDSIRLIKKAMKKPGLYSESELSYMKIALERAKESLAKKKLNKKKKGFGYKDESKG